MGFIASAFTAKAGDATRNLVRRRNRTALTLSGITISVASAFAVSALAIILLLQQVRPEDLGQELAHANPWLIAVVVLSVMGSLPVTRSPAGPRT